MAAQDAIKELLAQFEHFITTKTVVGEPIHIENTIILPLVDVSFGAGAGAGDTRQDKAGKGNVGGGVGAKMSPSAVLVIKDGQTRLVNIKNQEAVTKILDMVPDVIDRLKNTRKKEDQEILEAVKENSAAE